jgi:hypothetical protein
MENRLQQLERRLQQVEEFLGFSGASVKPSSSSSSSSGKTVAVFRFPSAKTTFPTFEEELQKQLGGAVHIVKESDATTDNFKDHNLVILFFFTATARFANTEAVSLYDTLQAAGINVVFVSARFGDSAGPIGIEGYTVYNVNFITSGLVYTPATRATMEALRARLR